MNQCKSCEAYITKRAKYCKSCAGKRKEKKSKVSPKYLKRGEIHYAGHRSLYDK